MKKLIILLISSLILSAILFSCEKDNLTVSNPNVVTDIDGNVYHSVTIGNQEWLSENLMVTRFNDGTTIKLISSNEEWKSETEPSYCWYNNIVDVNESNGLLYNFYCVNSGKLAPKGWHIPSDEEWKELELFIGMNPSDVDMATWRGGGYPIVLASINWTQLSAYGTCDLYGFSALPSGGRNGWYGDFIYEAYWWTSTQYDTSSAWIRVMSGDNDHGIARAYATNTSGLSVRCVKNKS